MKNMRTIAIALITGVLCFGNASLNAQEDRVFPTAEYLPSLPGCETKKDRDERRNCTKEKIANYLVEYVKYPSEAKKAEVEGMAVISFVVRKDGQVTDMQITDDPGSGLGEAAMKAVKKMNKLWVPGSLKGEIVSVKMTVPVKFVLPEEEEEEVKPVVGGVYSVVDIMPAFKGCEDMDAKEGRQCTFKQIMAYVSENIKYPAAAKEAGLEGTVMTKFVIDEEGNMLTPVIVSGIGNGCDEEALRLLNEMPKWNAGMLDDKAVKVEMELPFRFQLGGKE